jgi:gas vesicle protein
MTEYSRYQEQILPLREQEKDAGLGTTITWLLVGIGIGAGVALLLTPASGSQVRSAVARGYRRTLDGITRGTRELRQRGSNLLSINRSRIS